MFITFPSTVNHATFIKHCKFTLFVQYNTRCISLKQESTASAYDMSESLYHVSSLRRGGRCQLSCLCSLKLIVLNSSTNYKPHQYATFHVYCYPSDKLQLMSYDLRHSN